MYQNSNKTPCPHHQSISLNANIPTTANHKLKQMRSGKNTKSSESKKVLRTKPSELTRTKANRDSKFLLHQLQPSSSSSLSLINSYLSEITLKDWPTKGTPKRK